MGPCQEFGLAMQEIDLAVEHPRSDGGDFADAAQWHLVHEQPQDELVVENTAVPARNTGRRRKSSVTGLALPSDGT
jgi:hypothetical protein